MHRLDHLIPQNAARSSDYSHFISGLLRIFANCLIMKALGIMAILLTTLTARSNSLHYEVSFPKINRHYAQVCITIPSKLLQDQVLQLKVPVWTPGSYKIREFPRHLDAISAQQGKTRCNMERTDKQTWSIEIPERKGDLKITYEMYGADYGVRESYVGNDMIFLHGVSAFAYIKGLEHLPITLDLDVPDGWDSHCALPSDKKHSFRCLNYDELADSPIAIGSFDQTEYESGGTLHRVVMLGKGNYDLERIQSDFKKISDVQVEMFGGKHPSSPIYIHFIQNTDNGSGGLEHANCQTSQMNRFAYSDEKKYRKFLALVSHEYFHLWNIKRIRPLVLGPFDYEKEVYTDMLWIVEGITSYYDDLLLRRAGIHSVADYLEAVAENINRFENQKGKEYMSLSASSFNAWIKAYMPDENSKNVTVSYYNKGMLVALLLDQLIQESSEGERSLDDVMRTLLEKFYVQNNRGFTHPEFFEVCNEAAGLDLTWFFNDYVFGTKMLDYTGLSNYYGLELTNFSDPDKAYLGINVKKENGKMLITYVEFDSPAENAGLSVNDELVAFDGWRINEELATELSRFKTGNQFRITYARRGELRETQVTLHRSADPQYKIEFKPLQSELQVARREHWLR